MTVQLVHYTKDAERLIALMARVSNPDNAHNDATAPRLIRYLIRHGHWSPFEMASMCVCIETERDIAAQLLRHRSFSFQEFSTRYARTSMAASPHFRRADETNRQSSHDDIPEDVQGYYQDRATDLFTQSYSLYWSMLEKGVAKETARRILPLCTPTTLYMHGTLRSWIHYCQLRTAPDTQKEHRDIATKVQGLFKTTFPSIAEAAFTAD